MKPRLSGDSTETRLSTQKAADGAEITEGTQTKWTVKEGSAVVKIYLTPHKGADYFTISYWNEGKRKRQVFPSLKQAKDVAKAKAQEIARGDVGAVRLTNAESASYARAVALLEPTGAASSGWAGCRCRARWIST
jgi:hypothetical protein